MCFCAAGVQRWAAERWSVSLRGPVGLNAQPVRAHINLNEGTKWQAWDLDCPLKLAVTCFSLSQQWGWAGAAARVQEAVRVGAKQGRANAQRFTSDSELCFPMVHILCVYIYFTAILCSLSAFIQYHTVNSFIYSQQWQYNKWYLCIQSFSKSVFVCLADKS